MSPPLRPRPHPPVLEEQEPAEKNTPPKEEFTSELEEFESDDPMAHYLMAEIHSSRREFEKAIQEYEKIIRLTPDDSQAYFGMAKNLCQYGASRKGGQLIT